MLETIKKQLPKMVEYEQGKWIEFPDEMILKIAKNIEIKIKEKFEVHEKINKKNV